MSFPNLEGYFKIRCGSRLDPEAHMFPVPTGPRTKEYLDKYNQECVDWINEITKNDPHPDVKRFDMTYKNGDYNGRAIVYRPNTDEKDLPMVMYTHGGSFAFWVPEYKDVFCSNIAYQGNCVVVNLDFRQNVDGVLIPDMYEDVYQGVLEAVRQADRFGADPTRIASMGDSAGGQMSLGLPLLFRDRGTLKFTHRIVFAGGIGFDLDDPDNGNVNASKTDLMGAQNVMKRGFKDLKDALGIYWSPIYDPDMKNSPSATFIVGTADYMWREQSIYARKLIEAGVEAEVCLYPGMPHDFYGGGSEAAHDCWVYVGEQIKKHLAKK